MSRKEKVEIIREAIKELMDDDKLGNSHTTSSPSSTPRAADDENAGGEHRLSNLLSQLELLQQHEDFPQEESTIAEVNNASNEEVIKELKNVKRQNLITHCLLSALIVVTIGWQLSEFSLVMKIKDGLSNPLKSVGGIIGGFLSVGRRRHGKMNIQEALKNASKNHKQTIENASMPGLKMPHIDFPGLDSGEDEEEKADFGARRGKSA